MFFSIINNLNLFTVIFSARIAQLYITPGYMTLCDLYLYWLLLYNFYTLSPGTTTKKSFIKPTSHTIERDDFLCDYWEAVSEDDIDVNLERDLKDITAQFQKSKQILDEMEKKMIVTP